MGMDTRLIPTGVCKRGRHDWEMSGADRVCMQCGRVEWVWLARCVRNKKRDLMRAWAALVAVVGVAVLVVCLWVWVAKWGGNRWGTAAAAYMKVEGGQWLGWSVIVGFCLVMGVLGLSVWFMGWVVYWAWKEVESCRFYVKDWTRVLEENSEVKTRRMWQEVRGRETAERIKRANRAGSNLKRFR